MSAQSEEEQLAAIKEWWQRNGKPLLSGAALAVAGVLGWQIWQDSQATRADNASALYQQLVELSLAEPETRELGKLSELGNRLSADFSGTHYAQYASLLLARVAVEGDRLDEAAAELGKVLDKPVDVTVGELARQRLARVRLAQAQAEEALKLLAGDAPAAFVASREELRGDVLVRLNRLGEARSAYEKARAAQPQDAVGALQMKLDNLTDKEA
ncbi:tetratricopeptide repeat protein [Pseudomonas sp. NW5]|uniref:YfgM family protein n=1 Tax=Pseudomonas sp. NW5 TaxID=2934934 RepID=UPI00202188FC|nr:tetratricopeptide repeat protein [Pseudomonas sp. NW5]